MYDNKRYFQISSSKPSYAQWFIQLSIATWVGTETIKTVNFSAKNKDDDVDASDVVLDSVKNTYSGTTLKPFVRAGVDLNEYRVVIQVETNEGSKEEFYIDFDVANG